VFVLMVGLVILGEVAGSYHSAIWVTYTRPLLLEFVTGMLLGKLWLEHKHGLSFRAGVAVFAMGLAVLIANGMLAESLYLKTLGATLIVAGCLNERLLNWKNPYLKIVGDSTYSIYLSHLFTLGLLRAAWVWTFGSEGTHLNAISFAVAGLGSSLLGGVLLYAYLEAPVTRYLNRLYASKRTFKAS
jgi:exopolysaccharide production protein ExoZ